MSIEFLKTRTTVNKHEIMRGPTWPASFVDSTLHMSMDVTGVSQERAEVNIPRGGLHHYHCSLASPPWCMAILWEMSIAIPSRSHDNPGPRLIAGIVPQELSHQVGWWRGSHTCPSRKTQAYTQSLLWELKTECQSDTNSSIYIRAI